MGPRESGAWWLSMYMVIVWGRYSRRELEKGKKDKQLCLEPGSLMPLWAGPCLGPRTPTYPPLQGLRSLERLRARKAWGFFGPRTWLGVCSDRTTPTGPLSLSLSLCLSLSLSLFCTSCNDSY
uniref:Uncharacterized protein n=1 Tax=Pipistrellus kuhlii TaxID=59472 RepID=A0A7J7UTT8_PIPKU|nr:hypothetical protein mPipKuh1_008697 [Pipistrellus kuhlii]